MNNKKDHAETLATHAGRNSMENHGAVNPPVYRASTILFPTIDAFDERVADRMQKGKVVYGLCGTPTTFALEEAMTNAVRHGNGGDASKRVVVRYAVSPEMCVICVRDEGTGFEPAKIPDPTAPDRLSLPCGRGIMLIRAYMTDVEYRASGREVRMVKLNPDYQSAAKGETAKGG